MSQPSPVRVRFAPSPTGYLHIGGVRTALFNWLFARHTGGKFILRIEDTDPERSQSVYTEDILKSMQWLGLKWDEGPIFQSQRTEIYKKAAEKLVESGHAYWCTCSMEELDAERKLFEAAGKKPMYGGKCRPKQGEISQKPAKPAGIRFAVPKGGATTFEDVVRGQITFQSSEIEDFIIQRADGTPTYNLACVVDDFEGRMTHIIRGDDHINNTPKQCLMFAALGYELPLFVHLPMIMGPDKKKLSKRHGSVSANQYRTDGYLPHAVINYLSRLGWGHGDQEVFSLDELISVFSLERLGKSNAVFNTEKLQWLNSHYIKQESNERLAKTLLEDFETDLTNVWKIENLKEKLMHPQMLEVLGLTKMKVRSLKELASLMRPLLWDGALDLDPAAASQWNRSKLSSAFEHVVSEIRHLGENAKSEKVILIDLGIDPPKLEMLFRATAERFGLKLVDLAQPTRWLLTGNTVGPQLFDVIARVPLKLVLERVGRYADTLK